ncbi:MAG: hypothetical protein CL916_09200 [Deltaproteobacteria bacterium]|nr:hypothetical protein [Deltaproteobacteria bacterium]
MRPNFLIVGAPKCGTTAMWKYLQQHPDIFLSPRKDMHYFGSDLDFRVRTRFSKKEYEDFFSDAKEKARGEASVWYLFSKHAAEEIHAYDPNMKIIIMLRDPIPLMYAHYTQMRLNALGDEDITTFEEALAAEAARKRGQRIPKHNTLPSALFYTEIGRLSIQIQRYLDVFPREQILFLFQEDMGKNMEEVYRQTLEFLDVDLNHQTSFERVNTHKEIRSEWIRTLIGATPQSIKSLLSSKRRVKVSRWLRRVNMKHAQRPNLDPKLERKLRLEFSSEIDALSAVIGRNLEHWKHREL